MAMPTSHITDDSALDKRCRASVEASLSFFNLELGMVCIQPDMSLFSLISQSLRKTIEIFSLEPDSTAILMQPATVEGMLNSIFESDRRPFVLEDCISILAALDAQARACILAQAIAGVVVLCHKLAVVESETQHPITTGVLARELLAFARSEERNNVLGRVEHSKLFHNCLMKRDVGNLILAAVSRSDIHFESPVHTPSVDDYKADGFGWGARAASNMGVPSGFTIMALN